MTRQFVFFVTLLFINQLFAQTYADDFLKSFVQEEESFKLVQKVAAEPLVRDLVAQTQSLDFISVVAQKGESSFDQISLQIEQDNLGPLAMGGGDFGAGNGGGAIVCRDFKGKIKYAQLFDLWEWRNLGITVSNHLRAEVLLEGILQRMKFLNIWFYRQFRPILEEVYLKVKQQAVSDTRIQLDRVFDSNHVYIPEVCPNGDEQLQVSYEQLVNYTDNEVLLLSSSIFAHLSETDKAGLYLHEALYKMFRQQKEQDQTSTRARKVTAHMIANLDDKQFIPVMKENLGFELSPQQILNQEFHPFQLIGPVQLEEIEKMKMCDEKNYVGIDSKICSSGVSLLYGQVKDPFSLQDIQEMANKKILLYKEIYPCAKDQYAKNIHSQLFFLFARALDYGEYEKSSEILRASIAFDGELISLYGRDKDCSLGDSCNKNIRQVAELLFFEINIRLRAVLAEEDYIDTVEKAERVKERIFSSADLLFTYIFHFSDIFTLAELEELYFKALSAYDREYSTFHNELATVLRESSAPLLTAEDLLNFRAERALEDCDRKLLANLTWSKEANSFLIYIVELGHPLLLQHIWEMKEMSKEDVLSKKYRSGWLRNRKQQGSLLDIAKRAPTKNSKVIAFIREKMKQAQVQEESNEKLFGL